MIALPSAAPPPTVPAMVPSARTSILAAVAEGVEPDWVTMDTSAERRPASRSRMSSL